MELTEFIKTKLERLKSEKKFIDAAIHMKYKAFEVLKEEGAPFEINEVGNLTLFGFCVLQNTLPVESEIDLQIRFVHDQALRYVAGQINIPLDSRDPNYVNDYQFQPIIND
ncbi:hypothetical protein [Paenibacillus hubeiensis]|uniref:hypothetical protein n=1 Tax=Paenibacillus hubeiensis TaxID=3077330 RepID=UPI0031B9C3AA